MEPQDDAAATHHILYITCTYFFCVVIVFATIFHTVHHVCEKFTVPIIRMSSRCFRRVLKPLQVQLGCGSRMKSMSAMPRITLYNYNTKRMVSERSFAEERLKEMGEVLDPAPDEGPIEVDMANMDTPNAKVVKLVNEVLDLNVLEVNMFFKTIQVLIDNP